MTELVNAWYFLQNCVQHGVAMQAVKCVREVEFDDAVVGRHGFDETSCGVDRCLATARRADSQLNWPQKVSERCDGVVVGTFGRDPSPCVANGYWSDTARFLLQGHQPTFKQDWCNFRMALAVEQ